MVIHFCRLCILHNIQLLFLTYTLQSIRKTILLRIDTRFWRQKAAENGRFHVTITV